MSCAYISVLASSSQLPHHKGFSASFKISASYPALYQYLLDNPVSRPSFVPTVIAALHPFNRLWALVCPDLLWHSQAASVDEKYHDLAKWLSYYLIFLFFSLLLGWSVGKYHVIVTES